MDIFIVHRVKTETDNRKPKTENRKQITENRKPITDNGKLTTDNLRSTILLHAYRVESSLIHHIKSHGIYMFIAKAGPMALIDSRSRTGKEHHAAKIFDPSRVVEFTVILTFYTHVMPPASRVFVKSCLRNKALVCTKHLMLLSLKKRKIWQQ